MSWRSELVIVDSWWLWQLHPFQPFRVICTVFCGKTSGHQAFRWLQHIVEIHRLKNHGVSWMRCVQLLIVVVIVSPATWNDIWNTTIANCCIGSKKAPIKYMHHMVLLRILHLYWGELLELPPSLCFTHGILLIRSSVAGICVGTKRCSVFSCRIFQIVPYACRLFESAWMSQEVRINGLKWVSYDQWVIIYNDLHFKLGYIRAITHLQKPWNPNFRKRGPSKCFNHLPPVLSGKPKPGFSLPMLSSFSSRSIGPRWSVRTCCLWWSNSKVDNVALENDDDPGSLSIRSPEIPKILLGLMVVETSHPPE